MKILFLHDYDFRYSVGGAELNLLSAWNNVPEDVKLYFLNSKRFTRRKLAGYDKIVVGNCRTIIPSTIYRFISITDELNIPYIKSEHDIMWSDDRICKELKFTSPKNCSVIGDATKNVWYLPTKKLFENAEKVRFLSPKQQILFSSVGIVPPRYFIAGSYVDKSIFCDNVSFDERPNEGFCKSGELWGEYESKKRGEEDGVKIDVLENRGLSPSEMANFYNTYRYFYDYPILQTTYGRAILEAYLCGVELRIDPFHAIYSFGTIEDAINNSQNAIKDFWRGILE